MMLGYKNAELLPLLRLLVSKTFICHYFWKSKKLGSCQSAKLSSLFGFLGSSISSLERFVSGCFCFSHNVGLQKCTTVATFEVLGSQSL